MKAWSNLGEPKIGVNTSSSSSPLLTGLLLIGSLLPISRIRIKFVMTDTGK